jgi:Peptidase family M23
MLTFLLTLMVFLPLAKSDNDAVKITVKPQQVYIEQGASNQFLNFDFLLENTTGKRLRIDSIRMSAFDASNKLILRNSVDQHGLSPSIYTIPKIELDPKGSLYLFNPFYSFDASLSFKSLKYEFHFSSDGEKTQYLSEVSVAPIRYETRTNLILPFKGRVMAAAGHDFYAPHRRIDLNHPAAQQVGLKANSARYAYDFAIVDDSGEMYRGKGERLEDWFGYGAQVYSPGNGRVVMLLDEVPDNTLEGGKVVFSKSLAMDKPGGIFGNYLLIDHGNGEYSLFAHLKQGSFKVKLGEDVKQGAPLAQIGFSGNTDFVHTHYQLQNNVNTAIAEGLPSYFHNFRRILGSQAVQVKKGQIDTGHILER